MKVIKKFFLYLFLIVILLVFIVPFLYALYNSFLPLADVDKLVPFSHFTVDNYVTLFTKYNMARWIWNTVVMTLIIVLGNVWFTTMAGYALAKFEFPGRSFLRFVVIVTMMVPFQLVVTPMYLTIVNIGWNNTMASITVPYVCQCIYVFFAQQYFYSIPKEMEEAARIDGCGYCASFFRIIVPIAKPGLSTAAIMVFLNNWNEFYFASILLKSKEKMTIPALLGQFTTAYSKNLNGMFSAIIVSVVPTILIFCLLSETFVKSLTAGAVKG